MLLFLYFIFLGANLFLAIREKTAVFLAVSTSCFLWFLITGSRSEFDLPYYIIGYENVLSSSPDIQFSFYALKKIFFNMGFSFFEFRSVVVAVSLVLIFVFFKKISLNIHLMYVAYMLYLVFLDYIQFRNFFAGSVFYVALLVLVLQGEKWRIKFFLLVTCAATIHSSFWIYLFLLLLPKNLKESENVLKISGSLLLLFSVLTVFFRDSLNVLTDFLFLIDNEKIVSYAKSTTNYGGIYFICIQLFSVFCMGLMSRQFEVSSERNFFVNYDGALIDVGKSLRAIFYIDLLSFILCPLTVFNITFYRLIRNLFLLNVAGFSMYGIRNRSIGVCVLLVVYIFLWIYIDLWGMNVKNIVMPLFESNIYLK